MKKPHDRPVLERKPGFERGVKKPHIAFRKGFWYAFQNNGLSEGMRLSCPSLEWRWAWESREKDEPIGSTVRRVAKCLESNGRFSFCDTRNIQLRGLLN